MSTIISRNLPQNPIRSEPSLTEKQSGVAAVERALAILNSFRPGDGSLSLHDIAERTGLYKSTILRLIVTLTQSHC
ncbi:MAG: helix-turn-helix domain-containing protein, partial [Lacisediminimonas sp.]|nr:helix-turn-helix domain-containing protein [Lacisediminimonas sp.]